MPLRRFSTDRQATSVLTTKAINDETTSKTLNSFGIDNPKFVNPFVTGFASLNV